jgi:hypothetical protein
MQSARGTPKTPGALNRALLPHARTEVQGWLATPCARPRIEREAPAPAEAAKGCPFPVLNLSVHACNEARRLGLIDNVHGV